METTAALVVAAALVTFALLRLARAVFEVAIAILRVASAIRSVPCPPSCPAHIES